MQCPKNRLKLSNVSVFIHYHLMYQVTYLYSYIILQNETVNKSCNIFYINFAFASARQNVRFHKTEKKCKNKQTNHAMKIRKLRLIIVFKFVYNVLVYK